MGRGKGRTKGIDVTKHFFQPTGSSDLVSVRINPMEIIHVMEEELSPTEGSAAAFALKREGRMEVPIQLCANWRQGACHSFAACSNAHVRAYFDSPISNTVGNTTTSFTPLGSPVQRPREDWSHLTLQQQQHQSNSNSSDPVRVSDHKTSSTTSHSTPIPVPRSQQANRQTPATSGLSAVLGAPNVATQWNRKVMGNSIQQGSYSQRHSLPKQMQQHEISQQQQQYVASQPRVSWGGERISEEIRWATLNTPSVTETFLEAASHNQHGKSELTRKDLHYGPSNKNNVINTASNNSHNNNNNNNNNNSNNNVFTYSNSGNGVHLTVPENPTGGLLDDVWTNFGLEQHSACDATWCVGGSERWEFQPSGVLAGESIGGVATTPGMTATTITSVTVTAPATKPLGTGEVTVDGASNFLRDELNATSLIASRTDLWSSFSVSNAVPMLSSNGNLGVVSSPEALKSQLLRELVGAADIPPVVESLRCDSRAATQSSGGLSYSDSVKTKSEFLSLLDMSGPRPAASSSIAPRLPNDTSIEQLMMLLTKGEPDEANQ